MEINLGSEKLENGHKERCMILVYISQSVKRLFAKMSRNLLWNSKTGFQRNIGTPMTVPRTGISLC